MKALPVVLVASLALNGLCVAVALRSAGLPPIAVQVPAAAVQPPAPALPFDRQTWAGFQQEDPKAFVAHLQSSGFPPAVVRALLAISLREANAARRKALESEADLAFWKNPQPNPQVAAALRQLEREEAKLIRELLTTPGETLDPTERAAQGLRYDLDFLPPDKSAEVQKLTREFEERRADLYTGYTYAADRDKLTALEKQLRDNIVATLSPSELFEYDLRTSPTSTALRDELSFFNPTEQEFRAIYTLRAPFDEKFNARDFVLSMNSANQRDRPEAERVLREQLVLQLGAARAEEYTRAIDANYRRTSQLVARLELPPSTADQLYALQKEYEQRRNEFSRSTPSSREELMEQLTVWQQEATARATPLLGGARNFEAYKQYGGNWISNMLPRPAPARAVPPPAPR